MDESDVLKPDSEEIEVVREISCPNLENKFILVRVGTDANPAKDEQIEDIKKQLEDLLEENDINCVAFVTHHGVTIDIIEK